MGEVRVGDAITYVDPLGVDRPALVTAVWAGEYGQSNPPGVNLVFVSDDVARLDGYGRQMERATSVVHQSVQPAHGNYWK